MPPVLCWRHIFLLAFLPLNLMGKLKIFCSWLKKWRYFLASIVFFFVLISMFIYSVAGNFWLKYPLFLKTPLAFQKLSLSAFEEPLCHEDCSLRRLVARGVLVESLKNGNQKTAQKIISTLNDQNENLAFKLELLKAWREAFGSENPSLELLAVFQNSEDAELRSFFQKNFNLPLSSWRDEERLRVVDEKLTEEKRAQALVLLASKDPEFFSWSKEKKLIDDKKLLTPYLRALLSLSDKVLISPDFFEKIWPRLLVGTEQEKNLAIFLARANFNQSESIAEKFLIKVLSSAEFSPFSRYFAAEILNQQSGKKDFLVPEIKEQDWENYLSQENL